MVRETTVSRRSALKTLGIGITLGGTGIVGTGSANDHRGQRQLFAPLTHGESEQNPDRSGSTGRVTFNSTGDGTLDFELTARNVEAVTQIHIHGPAGRGEIAGVVAFLAEFNDEVDGSGDGEPEDGPISVTGTVDDEDLVEAILDDPTQYYVNVHTVQNPAGEIRGQLRERGGGRR